MEGKSDIGVSEKQTYATVVANPPDIGGSQLVVAELGSSSVRRHGVDPSTMDIDLVDSIFPAGRKENSGMYRVVDDAGQGRGENKPTNTTVVANQQDASGSSFTVAEFCSNWARKYAVNPSADDIDSLHLIFRAGWKGNGGLNEYLDPSKRSDIKDGKKGNPQG